MPTQEPLAQRRKPRQPIAKDDARFPHRQPLDRELRRILENARVTRATPLQAAAALAALGGKLRAKDYFCQLPLLPGSRIREFNHGGKVYAVKPAGTGTVDHGAGTHKYAEFAEAYRKAIRNGIITPELVLVKMKAYGTVEAHGKTFLLMEKINGNYLYWPDARKLGKDMAAVNPRCALQAFDAIELGRLKDGRPVVMLPHDYA